MDDKQYRQVNREMQKDKTLERDLSRYDRTVYDDLLRQVDVEYNLSWQAQYEKLQKSLSHLKLYNNQRKDPDAVGDTTLFSTHQTLFSSLYDDVLTATFSPREKGDEDKADNLTALAEFDYTKMEKNILDYMWDWDTLFFGRGLVKLLEFDRNKESLCPMPEVLDPMTFLHDPKAISVNGIMRGRGRMRFGGRELWLSKDEINEDNGYMDYKWLRTHNEMKSLLVKAQEARDDAQNLQGVFNKDSDVNLGDNAVCAGLEWYTHWKGKKVMVVLAQGRKRLIKYKELDNQDLWPIIDRPMYPHSHDWHGTSVPDLTEDKQRQKSVAINLGIQAMKSDLYPQYIYDEERVKNKSELLNFGFNKFHGVNGMDGRDVQGAVRPLNKPQIQWAMVNFVLNTLDASVQKATATPDIQTGNLEQQNRTLGELNLVASKVDVRYSLSAKVFGWSEKMFWHQWYHRYKENYVGKVDEKIIRLVGVQGYSYRPLMKTDFIMGIDPDIEIESKALTEAKQMRERILFQSFGQVVYADATSNKRFYNRQLAKLNGLKKDEIDILFPPTIDELMARKENDDLNKNKLVPVNPNDDHTAHLQEHETAEETAAKKAHIEAHIEAMRIQKAQPDLFPQLQAQQAQDQAAAAQGSPTQGLSGIAQQVLPSANQSTPTPQPAPQPQQQ
jgi:hypothetical protein